MWYRYHKFKFEFYPNLYEEAPLQGQQTDQKEHWKIEKY